MTLVAGYHYLRKVSNVGLSQAIFEELRAVREKAQLSLNREIK